MTSGNFLTISLKYLADKTTVPFSKTSNPDTPSIVKGMVFSMTISELLPRRVKQSSLATIFIPDKMGIAVFMETAWLTSEIALLKHSLFIINSMKYVTPI
ncbi:Uncharacterised protein [Chlamydia trachomatis]|nr:Uncharacterised protein [Chlamydia trachomatis]